MFFFLYPCVRCLRLRLLQPFPPPTPPFSPLPFHILLESFNCTDYIGARIHYTCDLGLICSAEFPDKTLSQATYAQDKHKVDGRI